MTRVCNLGRYWGASIRALATAGALAALLGCSASHSEPDAPAEGDSEDAAPDGSTPDGTTPDTSPDAEALDGDVLDVEGAITDTDANTDATAWSSTASIGAGDQELSVDTVALTMQLTWAGEVRVRLPLQRLRVGLTAEIDPTRSYSPTPVFLPPGIDPPPPVEWAEVTAARLLEATASSVAIELDYGGRGSGLLRVEAVDGRFDLQWFMTPSSDELALYRPAFGVDPEEGLYGLGEYFDHVNHRGRVRAMQMDIDGGLESGYNEVHVPIPLVVGSTGWGLYVDDDHPAAFALATEQADEVEAAFATTVDSAEGLAFSLFAGPPLTLYRHYYALTGAPSLPPRWALGPLVWRDENDDQAQVLQDALTMRELDLPCTGMWIDRPYATAVNTFDFSPTMFEDASAMTAQLAAWGYTWSLWHTPYLDESSAATATLRAYAEQRGYYPPRSGLALNPWGRLLDLSNPEASAWWRSQLQPYVELGIAGYKLDYAEDVVPSFFGARLPWEFADGTDERTMHARFQHFYHETYFGAVAAERPFLLVRHANPGAQSKGVVVWPGDLDSTFGEHREPRTSGTKTYFGVGGLPAAICASTSLSASGFAFFGSDTGGYKHGPPDKELFTRWFQHTAFTPVMQIGTGSSEVAWEFTEANGFDDEMLGWYRSYTAEHLRLWPFYWTYATRWAEEGTPIVRPFGLQWPALGAHPWDQYAIGDELLVAPVVERGAVARDVIFPPGAWQHWRTGKWVTGDGQAQSVIAPLDTIPVYQAAGTLVPRLRAGVETLQPTSAPDVVDSLHTRVGPLYVRAAVPTGLVALDATFAIYDGTEVSAALLAGQGAIALRVEAGAEFSDGAVFEFLDWPSDPAGWPSPPVAWGSLDELEGAEAGVWWDAAAGALYVRVPAGSAPVLISAP